MARCFAVAISWTRIPRNTRLTQLVKPWDEGSFARVLSRCPRRVRCESARNHPSRLDHMMSCLQYYLSALRTAHAARIHTRLVKLAQLALALAHNQEELSSEFDRVLFRVRL